MNLNVPLWREVDVLIFGAGTGAVAAALAARRAGKSVLCASSFTYPGEDVCATMNYWQWGRSGEKPVLLEEVFGADFSARPIPSPMHVKLGLEQAMIKAGVDFLYQVYPFHCLRDQGGRVAGAIIADRSGFQAIRAAVIIDAGERALFARRLEETIFRPFTPGEYRLRTVAAVRETNGTEEPGRSLPGRPLPGKFAVGELTLSPYAWEFSRVLKAPSPGAVAEFEVEARLQTWSPRQLLSADRPVLDFADRLSTGHGQETWAGAGNFSCSALQCGSAPVFVLGPMADVTPPVADMLTDPCALMALGDRLGEHAAEIAGRGESGGDVWIDYQAMVPEHGLEVAREDVWFRMADYPSIEMDLNRVPVLGEFEVVVVGGGTGGAPAGIGAARAGARTLILEYLSGLGGMGTEGRIARYYHGNRCGFTSEIDQGVAALGDDPEFAEDRRSWNTEWKKHWLLHHARQAGAEVWFGAMSIAGAMADGEVGGVLVATPYGCGLVKAAKVVDATGNADVAAAVGSETFAITTDHIAIQGTGLARNVPGEHYANCDYTFVDDTDLLDVTRAFAVARKKFADYFDVAQVVESRERRQIKGDLVLEPLDFLARRTFYDTIATASSNFDSHGFTIHPVFLAKPPDRQELRAHVPLRCLLPRGQEGILVTGLAISCHRDSLPVVRMQPDVQNQGYSAGRAAAMAAQRRCGLRELDSKDLQQHLAEIGILEAAVVGHSDSPPPGDQDFAWAVDQGRDQYLGLAIIFSDPRRSRPLLQQAYREAEHPEAKLRCAQLLGLLGDDTGVDTLTARLSGCDWDRGWHYTGMGQFGFSMSEMDSMLVALGRSGNEKAVPVILEKLAALSLDSEFSHCRAVAMALEEQPAAAAAEPLTRLLRQLSGNSRSDLAVMVEQTPADPCDTSERNRELKELVIARALLRCGDRSGLAAKVLAGYSNDLHGHYARHARALLNRWTNSKSDNFNLSR